jgi:23S rRNA pseudouridine1911/1915/1917 synthase
MTSLGHPLAGDPVYGSQKPVKGLSGQCLHAKELSFTHPRTGERMTFSSPLPDDFIRLLDILNAEQ